MHREGRRAGSLGVAAVVCVKPFCVQTLGRGLWVQDRGMVSSAWVL